MKMPNFKAVADCALLVELGTSVDDEVNRLIVELDHAISKAEISGVIETVPALVNLLVVFDPLITDHAYVQSTVANLFPLHLRESQSDRKHVIRVCYDDGFCPDLEAVAATCGLSTEAVIKAHSSVDYRVSMYGFAPGFAYMTGVPEAIQIPRKSAPVRDIPAGSIIIAGPQCLNTTIKMPTGWSIIGRSDTKVMTDDPDDPFLFDVGDTVTFQRIRSDELTWVAS